MLPADIVGEDLVRAMSATPAEEYVLVEDDGTILGVLTTADVDPRLRGGCAPAGERPLDWSRRTPGTAATR